jgi:hypothetical protein
VKDDSKAQGIRDPHTKKKEESQERPNAAALNGVQEGLSAEEEAQKNPNEDTPSVEMVENIQEDNESDEEKYFEKFDDSGDGDEGNESGDDNQALICEMLGSNKQDEMLCQRCRAEHYQNKAKKRKRIPQRRRASRNTKHLHYLLPFFCCNHSIHMCERIQEEYECAGGKLLWNSENLTTHHAECFWSRIHQQACRPHCWHY